MLPGCISQNKTKQNRTKCSEAKLWSSPLSHCWHVRVSPEAERQWKKWQSYSNSLLHAPLPYSFAKVQPSQNHPSALPTREPGCAQGCVKDWQTPITTGSEELERRFGRTLWHNNTPGKAETQPLLLQCWQAVLTAFESTGRKKP